MKKIMILCVIVISISAHSQEWHANGLLNNGLQGNNLGTYNNYPINIFTNGIHRAQFSTNQTLSGLNTPGDGLLIYNQQPAGSNPLAGQIAIFTSPNFTNGTEIRMGLSGNLAGRNIRLELWGRYNGLFYNTSTGSGVHKFARMGTIYGLLGTNNYWLLGQQTDNLTSAINATRRLHVFDNIIQFRLSYGGPNNASGPYTDFYTNPYGNLQVMPSGSRVGINLNTDPTANLDVNRNERIWNVKT